MGVPFINNNAILTLDSLPLGVSNQKMPLILEGVPFWKNVVILIFWLPPRPALPSGPNFLGGAL